MPDGSQSIAVREADIGAVMERVMIAGDLSPLTPAQRSDYYMSVCESLGLNHLTKPFAYIKLNGKLTLYALRDCTDQLRRLRGVSVEIVDRKLSAGLLSVHVRATDKDGRTDEDFGVVAINELVGEAGANAVMKAVTKAKRRVTLSICGLGFLDETEVTGILDAEPLAEEPKAVTAPKGPPPAPPKGPPSAPKAKAAVESDPFAEPASYARHLDDAMALAADHATLDEMWAHHLELSDGKLARHWQAELEHIKNKHANRIDGLAEEPELPMPAGG